MVGKFLIFTKFKIIYLYRLLKLEIVYNSNQLDI